MPRAEEAGKRPGADHGGCHSKRRDRGQLFAPGDPEASLIVQADHYTDDDLKMPPRGKLKDEQIADLVAWIKLGAPVPRDRETEIASVRPSSASTWQSGESTGPISRSSRVPPPAVSDAACSSSPIDAFILSRLDAAG